MFTRIYKVNVANGHVHFVTGLRTENTKKFHKEFEAHSGR